MEWDQREIFETEKQGLERENRRLKVQLKEMDELFKRKDRLSANSQGPDFKTSQIELQEKNKVRCSWETDVLTHLCGSLRSRWKHLNFYTPPIWIFPFVQSDGLLFFLLWCEIMLFMLVKQCDKFLMRMSEYDKSESLRLFCKKQKSESRYGSLQIWFPVTASCQCFLNSWSDFWISTFLHEFE